MVASSTRTPFGTSPFYDWSISAECISLITSTHKPVAPSLLRKTKVTSWIRDASVGHGQGLLTFFEVGIIRIASYPVALCDTDKIVRTIYIQTYRVTYKS